MVDHWPQCRRAGAGDDQRPGERSAPPTTCSRAELCDRAILLKNLSMLTASYRTGTG